MLSPLARDLRLKAERTLATARELQATIPTVRSQILLCDVDIARAALCWTNFGLH